MYDVLQFIQNNLQKKLSITETAKRFGYSKWYFCELFHAFTGMTFVEYIRRYRMQLAAMEIIEGHRRLSDISLSYGYDTQNGFNKAFLKEYGCLPRQYRKQSRESLQQYKERRGFMFKLSNRCMLLRENTVYKKEWNLKICAQRLVLYQEGELIVGYNFGDGPVSDGWVPQDNEADRKILKENGFSDEQIDRYFAYSEQANAGYHYAPPIQTTKQDIELDAEWAAIGWCIADNHTVLGYEKVLKLGFEGLLDEIERYERQNGSSPLYNGAKRICRASKVMAENYSRLAEQLAEKEQNSLRKTELKTIAQICRRVPYHPAHSLQEAIQSLFFAHIINTWEDGINANSLGRLDQLLYPYYRHDIDNGILTKEQAFDLICCLWIKLYRDYDVQQSCVGGCKADGSNAVNELSYLMLDATEELDFVRCLSVRYSASSDKAFIRRALEVVGHLQKGVPFFFNDDVMIPALVSKGIPLEDARGYTQIGCVETVIPGKSNPHAVSGKTNLLKALEYTLGNGHSLLNPDRMPGLDTGTLDSFRTYDAFEKAVFTQIAHLLENACSKVVRTSKMQEINAVKPYKSLLTDNCIQLNTDFNSRGAQYDYYQVMIGGVPNLADSLMVIKKFVFDEKKYTLSFLCKQLIQNFPEETIRQEFIHKAPKFGNDIEEVDRIAYRVIDYSCDCLDSLSAKYGYSFHAQPFTFLWMIDEGKCCAASPDGRKRGEIIAYSVSPMQGRDFNGFTALLNSIARLPTKRTPGTTSAIVEVDPKLFTDNNIDRFTDILLAAASIGLANVQFNTISADTLRDAQKNPDKYNNLAVRVSGFSQKFNLLDKEMQDHIIGRTKHKCL